MSERLHALLPLVHRLRDGERGEPLRALLRVLEQAFEEVRGDVETLSDAWFIETCPPELVPYIGTLVDSRLTDIGAAPRVSARAFIADTLALRRRKGRPAALEQAARAATGWPCRVVEGHHISAATASIRVASRERLGTTDVRSAVTARHAGTGLATMGHLFDVRAVETGLGSATTGLGRVGIHLWRMRRFEVDRGQARWDATHQGYRVCPFDGIESVLLNAPRSETDIDHRATEEDLPVRLNHAPLALELERGDRAHYFGDQPCVRIFIGSGDTFTEVASHDLQVGLLDGTPWPRPDSGYLAAFDPTRGRITVSDTSNPTVLVSTGYGAYADLGGGPYSREESVAEMLGGTPDWQVIVTSEASPEPPEYATLEAAVNAWNDYILTATGPAVGLILLGGSRTHELTSPFPAIKLPAGFRLVLAAGDWPQESDGSMDEGTWAARGQRAAILGNLAVRTEGSSVDGQAFCMSGVWMDGTLTVAEGSLTELRIADCTIVRVTGTGAALVVAGDETTGMNDELEVTIERSVLGKILCAARVPALTLDSCIVAGENARTATPDQPCIDADGAHLAVESCTFLGEADVRSVEASNTIFLGALTARDRQRGHVRYSWLTEGSHVPRRYACQPDGVLGIGYSEDPEDRPHFLATSLIRTVAGEEFLDPRYGRLTDDAPTGVREGADDGGEIGAFHSLRERDRERNLTYVREHFVRLGVRAGVFFES